MFVIKKSHIHHDSVMVCSIRSFFNSAPCKYFSQDVHPCYYRSKVFVALFLTSLQCAAHHRRLHHCYSNALIPLCYIQRYKWKHTFLQELDLSTTAALGTIFPFRCLLIATMWNTLHPVNNSKSTRHLNTSHARSFKTLATLFVGTSTACKRYHHPHKHNHITIPNSHARLCVREYFRKRQKKFLHHPKILNQENIVGIVNVSQLYIYADLVDLCLFLKTRHEWSRTSYRETKEYYKTYIALTRNRIQLCLCVCVWRLVIISLQQQHLSEINVRLTLKIPNYFIVISIGLCERYRYRCALKTNKHNAANCDLCKITYKCTGQTTRQWRQNPRCTCSSHHLPIYTNFNWFFLSYTRFQIEMRCNLIRFCSLSARGTLFCLPLGQCVMCASV